MNGRILLRRIGLIAVYFATAFLLLFFYSQGSPFCRGMNGHFISTIRLAVGCTAWSFVTSLCGAAGIQWLKFSKSSAIFVSVVIAFAGFVSLPFWLFEGYGHWRFESTIADVSCLFTEGYGIAFPYIVAPLLALTTLLSEILTYWAPKQKEVSS